MAEESSETRPVGAVDGLQIRTRQVRLIHFQTRIIGGLERKARWLGRTSDNILGEGSRSLKLKLSKTTRTNPLRRIRDKTTAAKCKKSVA